MNSGTSGSWSESFGAPRMVASTFSSMKHRNDLLAKECSRLKVENRDLKLLCRRLLSKELKLGSKIFHDKETQTLTDLQKRHRYPSPTDSGSAHFFQTPSRIETPSPTTADVSLLRRQPLESTESSGVKTAEKDLLFQSPRRLSVSPEIEQKVTDHLRNEVINEGNDQFSTPQSQSNTGTRPRRSTAKNISYIEPALNVKVRKNFYKKIFTEKP